MAKVPIKFRRVAAAFDEAVKWRRGPCDSSSGSEYWPESTTDLSDLVNSFIEKGNHHVRHGLDDQFDVDDIDNVVNKDCIKDYDANENDYEDEIERKDLLRELLVECKNDNSKKGVKQKILYEIEVALKLISDQNDDCVGDFTSRSGIKRNVMAHLRDKGFDAGLCKSRWEKTGRFPAGNYEYIDVNVGKNRFIIELFMAKELDIVRPTSSYTTLLDMIPSILIIEKPQILKQIIRLMSSAMKESLKHADMYVAPWRRNGYIQARYFSPYKRTINRESSDASDAKIAARNDVTRKRSMVAGFEGELAKVPYYYCRDSEFVSKAGLRVGLLTAALQGR